MSVRVKKWVIYSMMLLSALLFAVADLWADQEEKKNEPGGADTASTWIRRGVRRGFFVIGPAVALAWLVYHMIVQAFYPGLPL